MRSRGRERVGWGRLGGLPLGSCGLSRCSRRAPLLTTRGERARTVMSTGRALFDSHLRERSGCV